MKATLYFLSAFASLCFLNAQAALSDTNGFHLTVELQDGSRLIGKAGDENYQFHSDVLGEMELPLEKIRSIECQSKTNSVKLTTSSGDSLQAQFAMKEIRIETEFGSFRLPVNLLKQIQISSMGELAKNRNGLVALWSGEGNGSDSAGGNDATLTDVSFADGKVGKAFVFNGETSQITIPASTSLMISSLTFEGWIFSTELDRPCPVIEYGDGGQMASIVLWINTVGGSSSVPGAIYAVIRDQSGPYNFIEIKSSAGMVSPNRWNHIAFTYDTATRVGVVYCNGVQVASAISSISLIPRNFCAVNLGYRDSNSLDIMRGYRFAGMLDEIAIYNRALSAEEIKDIATEENNGEPLPPPMPNPQRPQFYNGVRPEVFN